MSYIEINKFYRITNSNKKHVNHFFEKDEISHDDIIVFLEFQAEPFKVKIYNVTKNSVFNDGIGCFDFWFSDKKRYLELNFEEL